MWDFSVDTMKAGESLMIPVPVSALSNHTVNIVKDVRETVMMSLGDESVTVFRDNDTIVKWSNVSQTEMM
jgi:hypothetical protein